MLTMISRHPLRRPQQSENRCLHAFGRDLHRRSHYVNAIASIPKILLRERLRLSDMIEILCQQLYNM
jgi:hypothetical protein